MADFSSLLRRRVAEAHRTLRAARENDDDYQVQVTLGQIESFARLAADNQIDLDDLDEVPMPYRTV